ncbi:transcriptional regulators [Zymobacter palmae]|uniref:Transcriptional regulators n=1 Tax=Zymobacter palmae TaxID=33074 RepID=A0A348HCZ9_9GAMM|nr:transcriptional regulators [Zymobacter palmae]
MGAVGCVMRSSVLCRSIRGSVMSVQRFVQCNGRFVGATFEAARLRMAQEQQIVLSGQFACSYDLGDVTIAVEYSDLGTRSDVQTGLDRTAVAERNADPRVSTDQAFFTNRNDLLATTGQRTHGGGTATQVGVCADEDASRNAAFDHAGAFGARVEVAETFVHDRRAFAQVGAQTHAGCIGNTYARRHDVVGHFRELVNAVDGQRTACQARLQLASRQFFDVDGAFAGPCDVFQHAEHAVQIEAVRAAQTMGDQLELEVDLRNALRRFVCHDEGRDQRTLAVFEGFDEIDERLHFLFQCGIVGQRGQSARQCRALFLMNADVSGFSDGDVQRASYRGGDRF